MLTLSRSLRPTRYGEDVSASAYHHGHLRDALVGAAVEAVRENGPDGWSLRDLCRRVGVSHNAAYRHFTDRDELVAVVSGLTMRRLVEALDVRLASVAEEDPVLRARRRLAEIGRGYVAFALEEPHLFRLAFRSTAVTGLGPSPEGDPYGVLSQALDDLVDVGYLAASVRPGAEMTCWSAVHGFAILSLEGPLRTIGDAERDAALDDVLAAIDRSYAATTGAQIGRWA